MKIKVILAIETIVLAFFIAFALIKSNEAEKQQIRAEQLAIQALQVQKAAESQAEKAEAMVSAAQKALEDCQVNK